LAGTLGIGLAGALRNGTNSPAAAKLTGTGMLATMGPGLPFAIAAQLAYPNRQSVAIVGDGGFTQLMGELVTAVKYQLPVKIIILKNNSLAEVLFEQKELGNTPFGCDWRRLISQPLRRPAAPRASDARTRMKWPQLLGTPWVPRAPQFLKSSSIWMKNPRSPPS
jgi:hypothetical protein